MNASRGTSANRRNSHPETRVGRVVSMAIAALGLFVNHGEKNQNLTSHYTENETESDISFATGADATEDR